MTRICRYASSHFIKDVVVVNRINVPGKKLLQIRAFDTKAQWFQRGGEGK